MDNSLLFPNLAPSVEDYPVCLGIISKVIELAPSDSRIDAAITLVADKTYHTTIAIYALCGQFKSEAKTFSLVTSLRQAQRSMLMILKEWKQNRFKNEKR